jgi:HK97 family phage major capsid protein/HK97 family phage prohead protease
MENRIAFSFLSVDKAIDTIGNERIISGMATTPTPDRVGDIVEPLGVIFKNPLPLLLWHDHSAPVGTVVFGKPTENGIPYTAKLPVVQEEGKLKDRVDEAWQSVKLGLVRAVSIGFRPLKYSIIDGGGLQFTSTEVFELSLVTVPANVEATIDFVKSLDNEARAKASAKSKTKAAPAVVNKTVKGGVSIINVKKETSLDFLETIKNFKDTITAKNARLDELLAKSTEATLSVEEGEEHDGLITEIGEIEKHIERLEAGAARAKAAAIPVNGNTAKSGTEARQGKVAATAKAGQLEKGISFAQWTIAIAMGKGNINAAQSIAANRFPNNEELNGAMKAAVSAGTTTDPTWAAPLVDTYQRFAGDFVEFLRPATIIGKFGTNGIPSLRAIPFNVSIAGQTSGGSAQWVGEGQAKPLTKFDFNLTNLRWAKVATISVLTEELIRFSNPAAEALVRDSLRDAIVARLDIDFVDPAKAAVTDVSPASITNGVVPIASSGVDANAVRADVKAIFTAFINAGKSPTQGVWIMSEVTALSLSLMQNPLGQPEFAGVTVTGGTFHGLPVITSQYIGNDIVVLADASEIYLADDGQVAVDVSREASLQMDSAPTGNSGTPTAANLVSLWQTNSVAIRAERWINWQKRRAFAVQVLSGVNWGAVAIGS